MYPCHSQMAVMVGMAFFIEMLEWQWHYDLSLDSLYLTATSHVRLYIFFWRGFVVPIFSPFFDLAALFKGIPLCIAHLVVVPPHMGQPVAAPPQPAPPSPPKSDPSEMSASSSSSNPSDGHSPGDPGSTGVMENGFLSFDSA